MNGRTVLLMLLLGIVLIPAMPAAADEPLTPTLYFYRDGEAVPVTRHSTLNGDPQADAEALLSALFIGPAPDEQASGLASPLPPDAELIAVAVIGDEATVDLRLSPDFLLNKMDTYQCDTIVEQIVKTLHPLGLHHIHVRVEDRASDDPGGAFVPISDFLPHPEVVAPTTPTNNDPLPNRSRPELDHVGQPPAFGQGQPQGALSGKTVWLSAGHGWYWSDVLNRWNTQRPNKFGIVEDFANAEAVNYYLSRYLWNAGADVWLVRERSMNENEVIVDNDDGAPGYTETGVWTTSGSAGYNGGDYRYDISAASQSASATWTPDLPEAGWYAVRAWYRHGSNRPTDARYEIHHAGGVTVVSISQEVHGQTWRYLGEYYFEAGTAGFVTLVNESDDPGQAVIADAIRFGGGLGSIVEPGGVSGQPRWEESAEHWTRYQGAPSTVYANDVTARPLYAEWETAKGYASEAANAVYISWHTNAGGGTGTNTYIHDSLLPAGSVQLQDWVHAELVGDLKAGWNPAWKDRGQKSANFGEVRELSNIPGVLLEVAFHDTEDPGDADDLREPVFRQIAARGVYQGIAKYFADRDSTPVQLSPEPPLRPTARNTGSGEVTLTWTAPPCCDGLVGDAATSYKVYQSDNGRAFDDGAETASTTFTLTDLPPGTLRFFRVTALNEGGESFPTPVVAVRTPADDGTPSLLIVDGFDRLDQSALIPQYESPALGTAKRMFLEQMNRYDHSVEHGQSLDACGIAFDGAVNEAIEAGDVALADYQAVDWFVGEEGAADASLNANERALLAAYLDGGGSLLISGAELGWDLVNQGRDPAFYRDYLRAEYLGDDATTYAFAGLADGPFDGLAGSFDNSTHGAYDVDFPDRLGAANGSSVALNYTGGTADGAAIAYKGSSGLVYFGFPLETVTDAATRAGLFCAAVDYLSLSEKVDVTLSPDRAALASPGQTVVYTHTLVNTGDVTDTYYLAHASSQRWAVTRPAAITLKSGLTTTLTISIAVPPDAAGGLVDRTVLTATSQNRPTVFDSVTDVTTVQHDLVCTPRLINPGFEGGMDQSAWQASVSGGGPVFAHRDDLPSGVEPTSGDWLAWLGAYTPGVTTTVALTQVVALPAGEPAIDLSLAWQAVGSGQSGSAAFDRLTVDLYDLSGTLLENLLTVTSASPASDLGLNSPRGEAWHLGESDLNNALNKNDAAYAGQAVQVVLRAVSRDTAFFVDDVRLTTCGRPGPDEFRALWVDAFHEGIKNRKQIDELVETAQAGNFNALVVQVRRRGDTYYPSALDPWAPDANTTFDALEILIERAHAAGIEVHAWSPTLAIWSADTLPTTPDHIFNLHGPGASEADTWLMTSYTGEDKPGDELYYLDPGHPDAADYIVALYAELAIKYDLDGVHLDRVRYPEPQGAYCRTQGWYCQDWGYNPTSVARFQAHTGRTDPSTGSGQSTPDPLDEQWIQWRRDQVTALVRRIYLAVTAINPQLRVSAAVSTVGFAPTEAFGWETRSPYRQQLQDWQGWLGEGILDLALPMIYRDEDSHAAEFDAWSAWAKDHQYGRASVMGTGLYLNSVEDSMAQWLRVRQPSSAGHQAFGLCGYSYGTLNDTTTAGRTFVNAAVTEVFTQPALVPSFPWKDTPTLGHLTGQFNVTQTRSSVLDNLSLTLTGPESPRKSLLQARPLSIDGSGWFGAVDLAPGAYTLAIQEASSEVMITRPVTITVGAVASYELIPPKSPPPSRAWSVYLPVVVKSPNR